MAWKTPWHYLHQFVYHSNTECRTGNDEVIEDNTDPVAELEIKRQSRRQGTGGKRLCVKCAELNRLGR